MQEALNYETYSPGQYHRKTSTENMNTFILFKDVYLCSIGEYFTSCAVFWWADRASQNINNKQKYSAILRNKISNEEFIIHHAKLLF